jgi:hypothetical protein
MPMELCSCWHLCLFVWCWDLCCRYRAWLTNLWEILWHTNQIRVILKVTLSFGFTIAPAFTLYWTLESRLSCSSDGSSPFSHMTQPDEYRNSFFWLSPLILVTHSPKNSVGPSMQHTTTRCTCCEKIPPLNAQTPTNNKFTTVQCNSPGAHLFRYPLT